jgi:hypothetical protein
VTKIVGPSHQFWESRTDLSAGDYTFGGLDVALYRFDLYDIKNCFASPLPVQLDQATGEMENEAAKMKIFPNPSDDGRFIIEWNHNESQNVTLELFNMNGQLVHKISILTGTDHAQTMLDFSNHSRGAYLLHIPELNIRQKIVIQ